MNTIDRKLIPDKNYIVLHVPANELPATTSNEEQEGRNSATAAQDEKLQKADINQNIKMFLCSMSHS